MSQKISTTLQQHLGWCPNAPMSTRQRSASQPAGTSEQSGRDGGKRFLTFSWYSEVRVQMGILGALMCALVLWGTPAPGPLQIIPVIIGAIAAIPLGGFSAIGYQKFFAEVTKNGSGNEMNYCRGPDRNIFLLQFMYPVLIIGFLFAVVWGWIPGFDLESVSGFVPGFVVVYMILYLLFLILWEKKTGQRMYMKWPVYYVRTE